MVEKIDISTRYPEEVELRFNVTPYQAYYDMLSSVFDFGKVNSVCDVGCSTGHLLYIVKTNHPHITVRGYEFFEYQKTHAPEHIRDSVVIADLRDPLPLDIPKYDLVNCSEVGEHIDADYAPALLDNVKRLANRYIVMTWSDSGGEHDRGNDPYHQHLNPLPKDQFIKLMENNGFVLQIETSKNLIENSFRHGFHDWWRKSLTVWKVKK